MVKVILTADRTLVSDFRHLPNAPFYACAPSNPRSGIFLNHAVKKLFEILAKPPDIEPGGTLIRAPYGLRKVEAALGKTFGSNEVVVVDPDYVHNFLDEGTQIVGVNTMNPLGLNPLTQLGEYFGGSESFAVREFKRTISYIRRIREKRRLHFKLVVGGSGAAEFWYLSRDTALMIMESMGIDHVICGEVDSTADLLINSIVRGDLPEIVSMKEFNRKVGKSSFPKIDEIPAIKKPALFDLVEVMRGCGRNCDFCEPNLKAARSIPYSMIEHEVKVNLMGGGQSAWLQSEDIWLNQLEDHKEMVPNYDALKELFRRIMQIKGILSPPHPTHGTIAPAALSPSFIEEITKIVTRGRKFWLGIQTGLETGSFELYRKMMPNKAKPFSPEEWPEVVIEGTVVFNSNYWYPVYTLIVGHPGETVDDVEDTIEMVNRLEYEVRERVGVEKHHFFIGPFPWIANWGFVNGKSFDLAEDLSKSIDDKGNIIEDPRLAIKRIELFKLCYMHMIKELTQPPRGILSSPWLTTGFMLFGPIGYYYMKRFVEGVMQRFENKFREELERNVEPLLCTKNH